MHAGGQHGRPPTPWPDPDLPQAVDLGLPLGGQGCRQACRGGVGVPRLGGEARLGQGLVVAGWGEGGNGEVHAMRYMGRGAQHAIHIARAGVEGGVGRSGLRGEMMRTGKDARGIKVMRHAVMRHHRPCCFPWLPSGVLQTTQLAAEAAEGWLEAVWNPPVGPPMELPGAGPGWGRVGR